VEGGDADSGGTEDGNANPEEDAEQFFHRGAILGPDSRGLNSEKSRGGTFSVGKIGKIDRHWGGGSGAGVRGVAARVGGEGIRPEEKVAIVRSRVGLG
jgi:hypothetical protein